MNVIKSISFSQEEILTWVLRLHVPKGRFDVDAPFSTGGFYRTGAVPLPERRFDLQPRSPEVEQADCRRLPLTGGSLSSLILDLPFLAASGPSLQSAEGNRINRRFGVYPSEAALRGLYKEALGEAFRVLHPGGVLVFKCQDKASGGKQHMAHCQVYNDAVQRGFEPLDLFVLLARSRLIADWQRNQKHARKFHCYFWVFRKPDEQGRRKRRENDQSERIYR